MAMNRQQFAALLERGLNTVFGLTYKELPNQWQKVFEVTNSKKAYEEDVLLEGLGLAPIKPEGSAIQYDSGYQLWTARYEHQNVASGFAITEEMVDDDLYGNRGKAYAKSLARGVAHTKEMLAAGVLNNASNTDIKGGDGFPLLSATHPTSQAGDQTNLFVDADLSETALENVIIKISEMTDDRGLFINASAKQLIIPPALQFTAERILKSALQNDTADNAINAIRNMGMLSKGCHIMTRLVDDENWFVQTDIPNGLKLMQRNKLKKGMDVDFNTGNMRYKATERYSVGFTDWRAVYGSIHS